MAQANVQPTWALIQKPGGYPTGPAIGKLAMIWSANYHSLYHHLSPYTDYDAGLLGKLLGDKEPFYYVYPDEGNKGLTAMRKYESRMFPIGSAPIDVIRVAKFLVSGRGVGFLATQLLLQTASPYNERRIYNPTSPIVAAGLTLTLGAVRPERMFDTSAGLSGLASTLLGGVGSVVFGAPKANPVSGTALDINPNALPNATKTIGAKGNLRAGTALRAQAHLQMAWPAQTGGQSSSGGFMNSVKNLATSLFQNFIPQTQKDIQFRSDEGTYGMMLASDFKFSDDNGFSLGPTWVAGKTGTQNIRKKGEYPTAPYKFYTQVQNGVVKFISVSTRGSVSYSIPTVGSVGYTVSESGIEKKPGYRYGDSMGVQKSKDFEASEMMIQYNFYQKQDFPSKDPESQRAANATTKLTAVLDKIKAASEGIYKVVSDQNSVLLMQNSVKYNYDRLFKTKNKLDSPNNFALGSLAAYRYEGVTMVSNELTRDVRGSSYKLPTAGTFDAINTLNVLDESKKTFPSPLSGRWTTWSAFEDDLIALYFYDVVNKKYIPFRAAISGISEAGNASWEEMSFIGRADKVYSYGGFVRNLSFTLNVVISSIAELAPTWQRINYIMTAYKPSNYTTVAGVAGGNSAYDRFMVPPMFMFTMGDLYMSQPVLIQSVIMTIPEKAAWETYNENNVGDGNWGYMAGLITSPKVKFGQVPREIELGFTMILLEKERAVVGGANFGHAPRNEEFQMWNTDTVPDGKAPNQWNKNYMVDVINAGYVPDPTVASSVPPEPTPIPPPTAAQNAITNISNRAMGGSPPSQIPSAIGPLTNFTNPIPLYIPYLPPTPP